MNVFLFFPQTHVCDIQNPQWLFFAKNPLGNLQNYFCSRDCVSSISNSAKVWKQISKLFWSSLPTLHIFSSAECSVVLIRFSMIENKNGMLVVVVLFRNKRPMLDEMLQQNTIPKSESLMMIAWKWLSEILLVKFNWQTK